MSSREHAEAFAIFHSSNTQAISNGKKKKVAFAPVDDQHCAASWEAVANNMYWYKDYKWLRKHGDSCTGWTIDGEPVSCEPRSFWKKTLDESEAPFVKWFNGGLTNASFNEIDRWILSSSS